MKTVSKPIYDKQRKRWIVNVLSNRSNTENLFVRKFEAEEFISKTIKEKIKTKKNKNIKTIVSDKIDFDVIKQIEKRKNKTNKIIANERFKNVMELILQGKKENEIIEQISFLFGVEKSTVVIDIFEQKNVIRLMAINNTESIIKNHVEQYEHIYQQARFFGFNKIALRALKQKEDLIAMNEEINIEFDFDKDGKQVTEETKERTIPGNILAILNKARV